uniref:Uncharacterized protein n=1 Tax=Zea mays TaxID=4577 RepID=A0A804UMD2_MAIZE
MPPTARGGGSATASRERAMLHLYEVIAAPAPDGSGVERAPVRRFERQLHLPHSPFPSISLVSDHLHADLPNKIDQLPSSTLRSLPAATWHDLNLVDCCLQVPGISGKAVGAKCSVTMPVDLSDPAWAESAREAVRCIALRVEGRTCRAVRLAHGAIVKVA